MEIDKENIIMRMLPSSVGLEASWGLEEVSNDAGRDCLTVSCRFQVSEVRYQEPVTFVRVEVPLRYWSGISYKE